MASNQITCIGQFQACALRVSRLDTTCEPLGGANDVVVTEGLVTMTVTPDVEEGTKFEPKTACGSIPFTAESEDVVKRYNVDLQLALYDLELAEILCGVNLLLGDTGTTWPGKVIGFETRGPNAAPYNGASLEIFARTSGAGGACGDIEDFPPYARWILPRFKGRIGERTFEDAVSLLRITGVSTVNGNWGQGPVPDEWEATEELGSDTALAMVYASELPTTGCGYVTAT